MPAATSDSPSCRPLLLALALLGGSPAALGAVAVGPDPVTYAAYSLADLQRDFDQLRTIATSQHPRLYADRAALDAEFTTRRTWLRAGMTELEFFRLLSPLVRRLNCGHTWLGLAQATENNTTAQRRLVPLGVVVVDGRLFVTRTPPGSPVPAGAQLTALNDRTDQAILAGLHDCLTADGSNLTLKDHKISRDFGPLLYAYVDNSSRFAVDWLDPATRRPATAELAGIAPAEWSQLREPAPPDNGGLGATEFAADHAVLFVKSFNYYDAAGHDRFNAFVDAFFNEVAARRTPAVILDVRDNGGGDPYCGAYLLARLLDRAVPYFAAFSPYYADLKAPLNPAPNAFTGPLYILANGGSFSTTGHFSSLLKYHGIGRFVGEETGGSFACTAATQNATLTRTQLRLQYSTLAFTTATAGLPEGRGIAPDFPVATTGRDRVLGRDPQKEFALSAIRGAPGATVVTRHPESATAAPGAGVRFSAQAAGDNAAWQWQRDGEAIAGATAAELEITGVQPAQAGAYAATVTVAGTAAATHPAVLGVLADGRINGPATAVGADIRHPNGNTYDQVLLQGPAASVTADPGQVVRISYVDLQDDIVQVEFSGAGTLTLTLDAYSGPAAPANYTQPGVNYVRGHARLVIAGADATTNVAVFSVGRITAVDQSLFRDTIAYDGWADLAGLAIESPGGAFGGVYAGNASFSAARGFTGILAPGVTFAGPVVVGDIRAADEATPSMLLGGAGEIRIAGGDLLQANQRPVTVSGVAQLRFVGGSSSHGVARAAQANHARFEQDGRDVTADLVVNPVP